MTHWGLTRATFTAILTAGLASWSGAAVAKGFWSEYNLGVTYEASTSYSQITYDSPLTKGQVPSDCQGADEDPNIMRCTAYLAPTGSSSPSLFLEKPFKRQGFFYFEPGLTFATVSYTGGMVSKPSTQLSSSSTSTSGSGSRLPRNQPLATPNQPLTKATMEMYGINWQGYLRLGITPRYFPDLFITGGLGLQTVGGRLKIFQEDNFRWAAQPEGFAEVSAVLVRFRTGAFSIYGGRDQSFSGALSTQIVEDNPSGTNLTNFKLSLQTSSFGARLLFPF